MLPTKFKYENKQQAITKKLSKQELRLMCTALLLMRSIYPQNFITIASIALEICNGQNSSLKKKQQRTITQKLSKQELRFICTASPLDGMYPRMKF